MPKGRFWTTSEDEVLVANANRGAECVRDELLRLGHDRSVSAVVSRAQEIGVSLVRYCTCPECGRPIKEAALNRVTGFCRLCSQRILADEAKHRREMAEEGRYSSDDIRLMRKYEQQRWSERKRKERVLHRVVDAGSSEDFSHIGKHNPTSEL